MITLEKSQLVKEMTTQPFPYQIIFISKNTIIAIDVSKQQALHTDPKVIWQTNYNGNLDCDGNPTMFLTIVDFSQGTITTS